MTLPTDLMGMYLVEQAMRGVRVVLCPRCKGFGNIGEPTLRIACPDCRGCGATTTNELEEHHA